MVLNSTETLLEQSIAWTERDNTQAMRLHDPWRYYHHLIMHGSRLQDKYSSSLCSQGRQLTTWGTVISHCWHMKCMNDGVPCSRQATPELDINPRAHLPIHQLRCQVRRHPRHGSEIQGSLRSWSLSAPVFHHTKPPRSCKVVEPTSPTCWVARPHSSQCFQA